MVVIAFVAYRYWRSTPTFARKTRESHARKMLEAYQTSTIVSPVAPVAGPQPDSEDGDATAPEQEDAGVAPTAEEVEPPSTEIDHETAEDLGDLEQQEPTDKAVLDLEPTFDTAPEGGDLPSGQASGDSELEANTGYIETELPEDVADIPIEETPDEAVSQPEITDAEEEALEGADDEAGEGESDEVESEPETARTDESLQDLPAASETTPDETDEVPDADEGAQAEAVDILMPEPVEVPDEPEAVESDHTDGEPADTLEQPYRLIEDLEPRGVSTPIANGSLSQLLKELDEQLEALPIGIELMNLPLLERRRVADRREDLMRDRAFLLEQRKAGAHRRRRRRRRKDSTA